MQHTQTLKNCGSGFGQVMPVTELRLAAHADPAALKKAGLLRPAAASAYSLPAGAAAVMNGGAPAQQAGGGAAPLQVAEGGERADAVSREAGGAGAAGTGRDAAEGTDKRADSSALALKVELEEEEGAHTRGGEGRAEAQAVVSEVTSGRVKVPRGGFGAAISPS